MANWEKACAAWRRALGREAVIDAPAELARLSQATFRTRGRVRALVRPRTAEQVPAVLRVAARFGVCLHPISRGLNWGYGSRVPPGDEAALLDLSALTRIDRYDAELGTVRVQPGVTFEALQAALRARQSPFAVSATGGPPTGSVLGNALERGMGLGPHGDHFAHLRAMEVVLPDGQVVQTGVGGGPAGAVHRWGVGPALDGLFSQSSLGVVVAASVALWPVPPFHAELTFALDEASGLPGLVEALRQARWDRLLDAPYWLSNDYRLQARAGRYPAALGGKVARPQGLPAWKGVTHLFGADPLSTAQGARALAERLRPWCSWLRQGDALPGEHLSPLLGPTWDDVAAARWRKRRVATTHPPDLDAERVGVLWYSAVLPERGEWAEKAVRRCVARVLAHGLEPVLSLRSVEGRALHLVGGLFFDREVPSEDGAALACVHAVQGALAELGLAPYRSGRASLPRQGDGSRRLAQRLKRALDPRGVLANRER